MDNNYLLFTIINTLAIIFIPIIAVLIGHMLQQQNYQNMQSEVMEKFMNLLNNGNTLK